MPVDTDILPPRYRSPKRIALGGMGEVYRATDSVLGRAVAVKLLAERYSRDDAVRGRFTREALAAARLSGEPNIVTVFDVGEHAERPFIVMEYLSGGSLEERIQKDGAQEVGQSLEWLEQAAAALDAAHRHGVVHRDVKPANLMLDRNGTIHVADFGIASAAGTDSLTMTGTVLGTAGYLSPEQAQGERATPASDRYALAVVAFELLSGRRPFVSESITAEAVAHVNAPVPSIAEICEGLPEELDAVFRQALAKDPAERFETASEFVAALRAALAEAAGATRSFRPTPAAAPPLSVLSPVTRRRARAQSLARPRRAARARRGRRRDRRNRAHEWEQQVEGRAACSTENGHGHKSGEHGPNDGHRADDDIPAAGGPSLQLPQRLGAERRGLHQDAGRRLCRRSASAAASGRQAERRRLPE